ncbi:MAG: spore maturation protein [Desulfobacterales bacterium]|jgi:spore maturation protein SpmA|nr:spore maturation protein [Desulfobacterales bacterium]
MNIIFLAIVLVAFAAAGRHQFEGVPAAGQPSPMELLSRAMVDSAAGAVELAIGLVGVMTLFLGLMKVAEAGGLLRIIARLIRPLMVRLFPDVPAEHPAMGAMILNLSANVMGLGNAATPFGIRAMQELNKLNPAPGTATDAMALFLAINTSSVTLLPTGVIALRAAAGSADPAAIFPTTLFATACSTVVAVVSAKLLGRLWRKGAPATADAIAASDAPVDPPAPEPVEPAAAAYPAWVSALALAGVAALVPLTVFYGKVLSPWIMPGLMAGFLIFGAARRVRVYEVFVEGAKEGFQVAVRIIPYLVAILAAVGMLRASGAMEAMVRVLGPWTSKVGLPAEALPMALIRPLSGSGAFAVLASILNDPAIGPDSYTGCLVSTLQGSTETTFYVLAVYFGAVQVRRIRYALAAGLAADLAGVMAAVAACSYLLR